MSPCLVAALTVPLLAKPLDVSADLAGILRDSKVPGLAAAAILDGEIVASGAAGVRKAGDAAKVTIRDQFHIGSCTKSMTATLAAMLVAEKKIHWQTTVADRFPELRIHNGFKPATLLECVSNTGGAPHDVPPALWGVLVAHREQSESDQRTTLLRGILGDAPAYAPGSQNVYSNSGFTIAGAMLERASGTDYATLISKKLFKPLHMDSAGFGAAGTAGKVDQPYGHVIENGKVVAIEPGPDADNPPAITPAGRVHVSMLDWAKYASLHLGTTKLPGLDENALEKLHTIVPPSKDYALGWTRTQRPWGGNGDVLTHNGTNTMNYAVIWLAPAKKFAVVAACNLGGDDGFKACDQAASLMIEKCLSH